MSKEVKPEIPDSVRNGVFATFFGVSINPEFAVIDFGNPLPEVGETEVSRNIIVSRIITTRAGAKQLADLINQVIKQTESTQSKQE